MKSQSVSVVMAVYNGLPYLAEQLRSVLAELQDADELIIVDDQSSDGSWEMLVCCRDSRITLMRNDVNLGVKQAFERALRVSKNNIIMLCDQDDVWIDGKRNAFVTQFEENLNCSVVVSDAVVIDGNDMVIYPSFFDRRGGFKGGWLDTLIKNRYLGCCMAFRRDVVNLVLPIPCAVPMHDMWFGMLAVTLGEVCYIDKRFIKYRRHASNVSPSVRADLFTMLKWRFMLFKSVVFRLACRKIGIHS